MRSGAGFCREQTYKEDGGTHHLELQACEWELCGVEPWWEEVGAHPICANTAVSVKVRSENYATGSGTEGRRRTDESVQGSLGLVEMTQRHCSARQPILVGQGDVLQQDLGCKYSPQLAETETESHMLGKNVKPLQISYQNGNISSSCRPINNNAWD